MGLRNQDLSARYATANRVSLFLDLISRIRKHVYICTYAETMFLHLYVYIKYRKFTDTSNSNSILQGLFLLSPFPLFSMYLFAQLTWYVTKPPSLWPKPKRRGGKEKGGRVGGKASLVPDTLAIIFWWISPQVGS